MPRVNNPSLGTDVPSLAIDACFALFDAHANKRGLAPSHRKRPTDKHGIRRGACPLLNLENVSLYIWTTCSAIFTPCSATSGHTSLASSGLPAAFRPPCTPSSPNATPCAVIAWVGVIWLTPIGFLLYWVLGINRIQRRAKLLRGGQDFCVLPPTLHAASSEMLCAQFGSDANRFIPFVQLVGELAEHPLVAGNRVTPLINGDEAYPAMLAAIDGAKKSVTLCSYIFDNDRAGHLFAEALGSAVKRGVETRVLIDSVGSRYTFPSIVPRLRSVGVRTDRFMRTYLPRSFAYSNMRSHRKILVVDGAIGFTGGLNIREGAMLGLQPPPRALSTTRTSASKARSSRTFRKSSSKTGLSPPAKSFTASRGSRCLRPSAAYSHVGSPMGLTKTWVKCGPSSSACSPVPATVW